MALLGYEFWKRVDELRGDTKLSKLANDLNLNYTTIRNQRSENRYPKNEDISKIARYLGTTEGYLSYRRIDRLQNRTMKNMSTF